MVAEHKFIINGKKVPVTIEKKDNDLWLDFPFNRDLIPEIKSMQGAKWHGFEETPIKQWSIADTERNHFQIQYLTGMNPYAPYETPLLDYTPKRSLYNHQRDLVRHGLTRHYCVWAAEMGVGKTLAAIELLEHVNTIFPIWWVGPRSALAGVRLEFAKWNCHIKPEYMTYEGVIRKLKVAIPNHLVPQIIIFDESSRIKNPTSLRSQAAMYIATHVKNIHGKNGYIILMSGSPAPKSPADWWHQCEVVCPGYLKEGDIHKFTYRLSFSEKVEGFSRHAGWRNNSDKCNECGLHKTHVDHTLDVSVNSLAHQFIPSINEVEKLYRRMKGLVLVKLKKECLDLPPKIYKQIMCPATMSTLSAARTLMSGCKSAIQALTLLRELSDGFQYKEELIESAVCKVCNGVEGVECLPCSSTGKAIKMQRTVIEFPTPKEDALIDLLDEHDDVGRIVIYSGFTASIERIYRICRSYNWHVIQVDGSGLKTSLPFVKTLEEALLIFQNPENTDQIAFVGNAGSAGMGITLTASPTIVYYSNDFLAESRIQSEDRIHRPGMDTNLGATIIDLLHLPTDIKVLNNLKEKRELQSLSMGEILEAMK